ncbi:response regulator [Roseiflexus castenholzii]|jgi:DNA-binding NarL/FixJ family response regulator|uniref:response regulator n=1 Tax=Roseiflexus castenholzii TaxID=120962 RepID=UPI0000E7C3CA|nr:response regulator transcription factor [Roseiflexus castenholzii]
MRPIRIAPADNQSVARHELGAYLATQPGITIIGEAASGEEALHHASDWQADVIVMDILAPGGIDGIETTRRLKRLLPQTQIVILSGYADDAWIIGTLRAGAIMHVEKNSQPEQLLEAVRSAKPCSSHRLCNGSFRRRRCGMATRSPNARGTCRACWRRG